MFSISKSVTQKQRTVTLYEQCLFCSMLRSIAVHMHSVFCVPCTVCDNVQQYADTAIICGNCSAVWHAVSLQYTCTEVSVSVHVHCRISISTRVPPATANTYTWERFVGKYKLFYRKFGFTRKMMAALLINYEAQRVKYLNWYLTNWTWLQFSLQHR